MSKVQDLEVVNGKGKTLREGETSLLIFATLGAINCTIPNTGGKGRVENMEMYSAV